MAKEDDDREYEEILESLQDENRSFDDFLNRKVQKICEPTVASKLIETDVPDAGESSPTSSNTQVEEPSELEPTHAAPVVEEKGLKVELHKHDIVGTYVSEQHITIEHDEEWKQVFVEEFNAGITSMTAEQIIERRHKLDRAVTLLRARDQGLQLALEQVLQSRNSKDRSALMEMQAQLRAQRSKRVVSKKQGLSRKVAASKPTSSSKAGPKGIKSAKTFINLGYDEAAVVKAITEAGLLDEATLTFIKKYFA